MSMLIVFSDDGIVVLCVLFYFVEVEYSVFGGLFIDNLVWDWVVDLLNDVDFYCYEYKVIYVVIGWLINLGRFVDVVMVYDELIVIGKVDECGGLGYLNVFV